MNKLEIAYKVKTGELPKSKLEDKEVRLFYYENTVAMMEEKLDKKKDDPETEVKRTSGELRLTLLEEAKAKGLSPHHATGIKKLKKMLGI